MNDIVPSIPLRKILCEHESIECLEKIGYVKISEVQKKAFEAIVNGFTTIVVSPTGTGKTEAALLPILYVIDKRKLAPIAAIYVTPLRALNRDIAERMEKLCKCFNINIALRHGDTPRTVRRKIRENPPHILVTTPETFQYIITDEMMLEFIKNLRFAVIDELRELVTSKRGIELLSAINIIERIIGRRLVKVGLTATLSNHLSIAKLLDSLNRVRIVTSQAIKNMEIEVVTPSSEEAGNIDGYDPALVARVKYVIDLIKRYGSVLIFVNTRDLAERLSFLITRLGKDIKVGVHHGSLSREHRISIERLFKDKKINALVATSSLELGIDVGHINYVIQYMSPRQSVKLVQRIGRSFHTFTGVSKGSIITLDNLFDILESIALARRSLNNILEREEIPQKPLDVLAHQIVARVLIEPGVNLMKLYHEFYSSRVFNNIDYDEFMRVIEYLEYSGIIRVKNNRVYMGRRTKTYYYNVTMIPDTRNVPVIDLSSNKKIGVLNEEFVILNCEKDTAIVLAGGLWKVIDYDKDTGKLYVEPLEASSEAIIPRWEGETIPVDYYTSREIGAYLRLLPKYGFNLLNIPIFRNKQLLKVSKYSLDKVADVTRKAYREFRGVLPSDNLILVEINKRNRILAIYSFIGNRGNNLLRELITAALRKRLLGQIYSTISPYYILIQFPKGMISSSEILDIFKELIELYENGRLLEYIEKIVKNSNTYLWRIYFVAQRFGAIDVKKTNITRSVLQGYVDTVIGREAFKETMLRDYDLNALTSLLSKLRSGEIKMRVIETDEPSILLKEALQRIPYGYKVYGVIDLNEYKNRLLNKKVTLLCIICGHKCTLRLKDIIRCENISCPNCRSKALAAIKGDGSREYEILKKVLSKKRIKAEELKVFKDLQKRALLVMNYGINAIIALASLGVGPHEAQRILGRVVTHNEDLIRLLYEAEKKFIRIKKYLD